MNVTNLWKDLRDHNELSKTVLTLFFCTIVLTVVTVILSNSFKICLVTDGLFILSFIGGIYSVYNDGFRNKYWWKGHLTVITTIIIICWVSYFLFHFTSQLSIIFMIMICISYLAGTFFFYIRTEQW